MRADHLYVHVPFCSRRCVYCDFSIAVRATVPVEDFLQGLERELSLRHAHSTLSLETVYLGGGTPSKLGGEGVARVLDLISRKGAIARNAEITIEANPEDVNAESVRALRAAGVNRVSLGVQSFADRALRWMHRSHDAETAKNAVQVLREGGIGNISIDLIFATPPDVERSFRADLDALCSLGLPHASIYGLTVEPHTPLGRWVARREAVEAPEDRFESEFLAAHAALTGAGYEHYEVSNYGLPGQHSRHNWAYWQRKAYVGIGPSAHEFDGVSRRWNVSAYAAWHAAAMHGADTTEGSEQLSEEQVTAEQLYLGLRTSAGIPVSQLPHDVAAWLSAGWATVSGGVLRLTPTGWLRLDALAGDLTAATSRY